MGLFQCNDYREFIEGQFKSMPKRGYGQARRMAEFLNVHTTLISQVLKGKKTLTLDQAAGVAEFLALTEMETDFFLLLVQFDRAGSPALRKNLKRQIDKMRLHSKELVNRLSSTHKLKEEERAVFYSDWTYSAVRQLSAIRGFQNIESIADYLGLSRRRTKELVDFLLKVQLCVEERGGIKIGPASTHVESSSAWVRMHHSNWRQRSIDALSQESEGKLHYTAPMTLAKHDVEKIREMITKFLESVDRVVEPSPSEVLYCLNIDWFEAHG